MKPSDCVTDHNSDADVVQVLGIIAFVFFLIYSGYSVYHKKEFDPVAYSTGAAALLLGIGGGYWAKNGTTPTTTKDEQIE